MKGFWRGAAVTSATDEYATPTALFRSLDAEFGFTLDVCATKANAACRKFYTREDDGLAQPWSGVVWCNPPYGRTVGQWIERAYLSSQMGTTVVMLVPARTDTAWWHRWALKATEVRYIQGRLKFGGAKHNAPFASALLVFRP